jgi:hypothetical protein
MNDDDYWFDENEIRKWFFDTSDFFECCAINLTDLYQFSERGRIGKGKFIKLIDWLYFRR